jgi:cell division protein FtsQ
LQQVGAQGFADAQLVDPRQLPAPLNTLSRQTRIGFSRAWILHRKVIVRCVAAAVVLAGAVGLYEGREQVTAGAMSLYSLGETQFAKAGYSISRINMTGQNLTSDVDLFKALDVPPNTLTLMYDADAALARIKAIPSIKTASIRKIYPNELQVTVTEKVPMARWRIGDKTYLVDEEGSPVAVDDGSFRELPLVVGEGAADDAMVMIHALNAYPAITADLAALSRIGDRRWDLIFYSGLRVQLPENGVAQALSQLNRAQQDQQLLDRDVTTIDLRVPGMLSLKLGDLSAKAWADFKKKHKHTSKGESDYETPAERAAESSKPQ